MAEKRADRVGSNRTAFEKNARYIYKTQEVCGICGLPVDMTLKSPDPMSKTIDHIIPVSKGGHPSDLANLQLAHRCCNRQKGSRLYVTGMEKGEGAMAHTDFKNTRGVKNNPLPSNPRARQDTGEPQNGQEVGNRTEQLSHGQGYRTGFAKPIGLVRPLVDNDNIPQHADWSEYMW